MNTPVSFELAKLLKEKGFDYQYEWNPVTDNLPTIAEVVMWLYEKHGIWIYVRPFSSGYFHGYIVDNSGEMKEAINTINFNSPTEAYEAAIEYVLNNLI